VVCQERAILLPGQAGDLGFLVDKVGRTQADKRGRLDAPVAEKQLKSKTVQESKPLAARSSSPTGSYTKKTSCVRRRRREKSRRRLYRPVTAWVQSNSSIM